MWPALLALACFAAGGGLALAHPVQPVLALLLFYTASVSAFWLPRAWLLLVPACLPWLNFAPWTGWLSFDEFDMLLLALLAGGYARQALLPNDASPSLYAYRPSRSTVLIGLWAAISLLALQRGLADAGGWRWGWFQSYTDPLNSLRLFKSLLWSVLFVPLLHAAVRQSPARAGRLLASGMVAGLAVVALAVLWERAAFPSLFNFSGRYRTTALFWEMHVGGAALDGYLALATPFVVWALRTAKKPWQWALGAMLALAVAYAGLTSFSRGVYASMVAPLVLLGGLLWVQKAGFDVRAFLRTLWLRRRPKGWRAKAAWVLTVALVAEVLGVLNGGTFMADRIADTERDFGSRVDHWQRGLSLLDTPAKQLLGQGLGRLPARYAKAFPEGEWSGRVEWLPGNMTDNSKPLLRLHGPDTDADLGNMFALSQRVTPVPGARFTASLRLRVDQPVDLYVQLCERHLLYVGRCQNAYLQLEPAATPWQDLQVPLRGPSFKITPWFAPRLGLLTVAVLDPGMHVDFQSIGLRAYKGKENGPEAAKEKAKELLANGDFADNLAHWFPAARSYFLPWHIDNLYLEVLIDRGAVGLLVWAVLMAYALWCVTLGRARQDPLAPYLAASLSGVLVVGLVSSVMDVPRVAFLLFLLAFFALRLARASPSGVR